MIVFFLDSCALARRYFSDIGSRVIRAIEAHVLDEDQESLMAYTSLALVELESVLNQLSPQKRFKNALGSGKKQAAILKRVVTDAQDDLVIPHCADLEIEARRLIWDCDLRALDALQLAGAVQVYGNLTSNERLVFVSSDRALVRAVGQLNLANFTSLDFITCVCTACGKPFHPPLWKLGRKPKSIPCPSCGVPIACQDCYRDITKCTNQWMPNFLQPYASCQGGD